MKARKSVLVIGFEPTLLDYTTIPDLDAAKVMAGLKPTKLVYGTWATRWSCVCMILAKLRRQSFEIDSGRSNSMYCYRRGRANDSEIFHLV